MQSSDITREELLKLLKNVEEKYPVDQWRINNVLVWPLIKIDIFFRHVKKEGKDEILNKSFTALKNQNFSVRILNILKSIYYYLVFLAGSKYKNITIMFSDSEGHRVKYKDEFINRYFQPISEYMSEIVPDFKTVTLNDEKNDFLKYPRKENICFVNKYLLGAKFFDALRIDKYKHALEKFENFIEEISCDLAYLNIDKTYINFLNKKVSDIITTSKIVDKILVKWKPKVIFELCYYSNLRFAINLAAKKRNIKTVEIQHGGMGRDHVSYSGWNNIPRDGYDLLPNVFWVWDESSEMLISNWIKNQDFHEVILGGNPWLGYSLDNDSTEYHFPREKKIILYTLQYSEIDDYILDAIASTNEEYQWWLRLHPRKIEAKEHIKEILKARNLLGTSMVEIDKATSYPLPQILKNAYVHLSGASGSIIEAAQSGVLSLVLDEIGTVYYKDIISAGAAISMIDKSADLLLAAIRNVELKKNRVEERITTYNYKKIIERFL